MIKVSFGDQIRAFNNQLDLSDLELPNDIQVLNPFISDNASIIEEISAKFYGKFYTDHKKRKLILGINPGRLGAGSTGIPFTDTKRLGELGISVDFQLHEPSSVFVYEVIEAYGGPNKFYSDYYIGSVCPLGFVKRNAKGNFVNYNYYDDKQLQESVEPFILKSLKQQLEFGLLTEKVFCFGTGKNYKFLNEFNKKYKLFKEVIPLEHPRYVMQYKSRSKEIYINKFIDLLS